MRESLRDADVAASEGDDLYLASGKFLGGLRAGQEAAGLAVGHGRPARCHGFCGLARALTVHTGYVTGGSIGHGDEPAPSSAREPLLPEPKPDAVAPEPGQPAATSIGDEEAQETRTVRTSESGQALQRERRWQRTASVGFWLTLLPAIMFVGIVIAIVVAMLV